MSTLELQRIEGEQRQRELDLRLALDNLPGLVCTNDAAGEIEAVNETLLRYTGLTLAELKDWAKVVHPEELPQVQARWAHSVQTGEPFASDMRIRGWQGLYRWFHSRSQPSRDSQGNVLRWYFLITDIHDRKLLEQDLRRSEAFLLEAQRLTRAGSWRYDGQSGEVESSPEILRAYGIPPGEEARCPSFWFDRIHPEDRERVVNAYTRAERERAEYRADYRILRADGSIGYQHSVGRPIVDESGQLLEFIGAAMDITEHWLAKNELEKAADALRTMQSKLSRAAQVATVGELSAAIAHEINQPLAAVVANGHACRRWLAANPPNLERALEAVERIVQDGKDAGEVVRRIRSLFKRGEAARAALDLNEVVQQVLTLVAAECARRRVRLEVDLAASLPAVLGDRVQLQHLLLNLLLNGVEAMDGCGERAKTLTVRTSNGAANTALVEVRDTGVGLPDPERVFEPFFTTKTGGLGMGLAICRSIAEAHDGKLWAAPGQSQGSTFCFAIPLSRGGHELR